MIINLPRIIILVKSPTIFAGQQFINRLLLPEDLFSTAMSNGAKHSILAMLSENREHGISVAAAINGRI
jgi:hypothetical protein